MSARKDDLRRRREKLVGQAAAQRDEMSSIAADLQSTFRWADRGFAVGQVLRSHPALAMAAGSLLVRVSRSHWLVRVGQVFTAWELFSIVRKRWTRI
ncbi:YqjK family protein [Denitromonas halophila]|uniref:YqjK-like protein n=1 Tax=Denitromonas halophila TaxID=1629404 RepID=A0A557QKH1_9RHOO|nr:YqjK family protein [Denitromonas halophila]TVO53408.1 hypothetical protein FHP91_16680 [Denitromonas halophila]